MNRNRNANETNYENDFNDTYADTFEVDEV